MLKARCTELRIDAGPQVHSRRTWSKIRPVNEMRTAKWE